MIRLALYLQPSREWNEGVDAVCSLCGRMADPLVDGDPPIAWCADVVETSEGNRTRWVCTTCTRHFVRSIEAKLEQQWW